MIGQVIHYRQNTGVVTMGPFQALNYECASNVRKLFAKKKWEFLTLMNNMYLFAVDEVLLQFHDGASQCFCIDICF